MKRLTTILLALIMMLVLSTPMAANAAEHDDRQPDYTKTGSIAVDITTAKGEAVNGGSLTAYLVADAVNKDGDNVFVLMEDFKDSGLDLSAVETEENGSPKLAATAAAYAAKEGIKGKTVTVDEKGHAVFPDLTLGLYVVVQAEPAQGYEPIRPFAVTVPFWDGSKLVYDVTANPKPESAVALAKYDPPMEKLVVEKNGKAPKDSKFVFRMEPKEPWYPMPDPGEATYDPSTGSLTITVQGAGSYEFGWMYYGKNDIGNTYQYDVYEVKGDAANYEYDTQIYTMTIEVTYDETAGEIKLDVKYTDKNGNEVDTIKFTNIYDEPSVTPPPTPPTPPTPIPDTGQLWWPVPLLAAAGLALVAFGLIRNRREKKA
ncbi:MAG: hypothetical protein IJL53_00235 [Firmicutes bacterium]|nr:hypothetical protein [Bacillota bacterium]